MKIENKITLPFLNKLSHTLYNKKMRPSLNKLLKRAEKIGAKEHKPSEIQYLHKALGTNAYKNKRHTLRLEDRKNKSIDE